MVYVHTQPRWLTSVPPELLSHQCHLMPGWNLDPQRVVLCFQIELGWATPALALEGLDLPWLPQALWEWPSYWIFLCLPFISYNVTANLYLLPKAVQRLDRTRSSNNIAQFKGIPPSLSTATIFLLEKNWGPARERFFHPRSHSKLEDEPELRSRFPNNGSLNPSALWLWHFSHRLKYPRPFEIHKRSFHSENKSTQARVVSDLGENRSSGGER